MRVLFASHLGSGTGHLHVAAAVRDAVEAQGARCSVAVRDPVRAQTLSALESAALLPSPDFRAPPRKLPSAVCWAEAVLSSGHGHPDVSTGLVSGWLGLLDAIEPDVVVTEFCPTALLAARVRGIAACSVGSGFTVPPAATPMPTLQPWLQRTAERIEQAERMLSNAFDEALARFGAGPLGGLDALYPPGDVRLLNVPEFDHYGMRSDEVCIGPVDVEQRAVVGRFPSGEGPTLFAYYHPDYPHFPRIVEWIRQSDYRTLLVAPGLPTARAEALSTDRLIVRTDQVALGATLQHADLALLHGGQGSLARTVLAGVPTIVVPQFIEQAMLAHRLGTQRLALGVNFGRDGSAPVLATLHDRLMETDAVSAREAFVRRHAAHDPQQARDALGAWILDRAA